MHQTDRQTLHDSWHFAREMAVSVEAQTTNVLWQVLNLSTLPLMLVLGCSYQYFMSSLPWASATFHTLSQGLDDLGEYLLRNDRVALELLYKLDWAPVLEQLGDLESTSSSRRRAANDLAVNVLRLVLLTAVLVPVRELPKW